jgi:hypothetical protein
MTAPAAVRPTLADWQRDLAGHALHGDAVATARLRPALAAGPVPIDDALEIHASTVHHALFSALRQRVPTVEALVGENFLRELTREFSRQHPPRHPQLALWGLALPEFIAGHAGCQGLPYLADAAAFDLALDEVALVDAGRWGECQALVEGLALQTLDGLRVFSSTFAVDQLRDAVLAAQGGDEAALQAVSLAPGAHHYALWCAADAHVHCRVVSSGLAAFLAEWLAASKEPKDTGATNKTSRTADAETEADISVESALHAALAATGTAETEASTLFTGLVQELAALGGVRLLQSQA